MKNIKRRIYHCSASTHAMYIGVKEITQWHLDRGFNDIGYHIVVRKNGSVEFGRPFNVVGAHCKGYNRESIGICWVGGYGGIDDRTEAQKTTLKIVDKMLNAMFPESTSHGHNEFSSKTCPNFNVSLEFG